MAIALLLLAISWAHELRAECAQGYAYSAPITITNSGPTPLTGYQARLVINTARLIAAGKMKPMGADLRFVFGGDCCSPLSYWVESGMNTDSTIIWVKIPLLPAGGSTTITMFYGNPAAADGSDPASVFPLFEDFTGGEIDQGRWELRTSSSGQVEVNSGVAKFATGNDSTRGAVVIVSRSAFPTPVIAEMMVNEASGMWPHLTVQIPGAGLGYGPFMRGRAMFLGVLDPGGSIAYQSQTFLTSAVAGLVNGIWNVSWWATAGESISWPGGFRLNTEPRYAQYDIPPAATISLGIVGPGPGRLVVDWVRVRPYVDPVPTASAPGPEQVEPAPTITGQPQNRATCEGMPATFTVSSDGAAFQWRHHGTPIPGATGSSLTIAATTAADTGTYDVVVAGSSCGPTVLSAPARLTFNMRPAIMTEPEGTTICAGSALELDVTATGSGLTYRWRRNGAAIPGATGARLLLPASAVTDAGSYDVVITGICGESVTSTPAAIAVMAASEIAESPHDVTICREMTFTLSASATGTELRYQWRRNGVAIPGATSPVYSHRAQPYDDGIYELVVTGRCGAPVTTRPARVTVTTEPIISEGPVDRSVREGEHVTFSVRVTGGGSIRYQWRKDGVDIPGATLPLYTIASASPTDVGTYEVVVTGTACTTTAAVVVSERAVLALDAPLGIVAEPAGRTACPGGPAWFAVNATGSSLRYQWRKDGTPIAGATAPLYRIAAVTAADAGSYDVVITDADGGSITSAGAVLAVTTPIAITSNPADLVVCAGESATITVAATGDGLTYQWLHDGSPIAGAQDVRHTITAATGGDAGRYEVVITGGCGDTLRSAGAMVTVSKAAAITRGPAALRVRAGEQASFSVEATGSDLRYRWEHDGASIAGAEGPTYTIARTSASDSGSYRAIVAGLCPPADTSLPATLVIETTSGVMESADEAIEEGALVVLPQPAHGMTRLLVKLPRSVRIGPGARLTLHDASGREVADLSESFARDGFTGADLDAGSLPSGRYYCRIVMGRWERMLGVVVVMH
jgi:hypothetical protein